MNFASIGTISAYTKSMKLEANWKKRQDSNDFSSKLNSAFAELGTNQSMLDEQLKQSDPKLLALYTKVYNGKKLTAEELEYLRGNNPELYKKAKEVEAEAERYRQELKKCRTKEEVEHLKTVYIGVKMARVNSIANNPNIPKGAKMGLLAHENAQVNAVMEEERKFKESTAYQQLETEAERNERIRREQEKLHGRPEKTDQPPETDETENHPETDKTDRVPETDETEYHPETDEIPETDRTPESDRPLDPNRTPEPDRTPETDQIPETNRAVGTRETGVTRGSPERNRFPEPDRPDAPRKTGLPGETDRSPEPVRTPEAAAITFDEYMGQKQYGASVSNESYGRMSYKNAEAPRKESGGRSRLPQKRV